MAAGKVPHVKGGGYVGTTTEDAKSALKKKQRADVERTFNQPDPVGDFVRRVIGGNKAKKQQQ